MPRSATERVDPLSRGSADSPGGVVQRQFGSSSFRNDGHFDCCRIFLPRHLADGKGPNAFQVVNFEFPGQVALDWRILQTRWNAWSSGPGEEITSRVNQLLDFLYPNRPLKKKDGGWRRRLQDLGPLSMLTAHAGAVNLIVGDGGKVRGALCPGYPGPGRLDELQL